MEIEQIARQLGVAIQQGETYLKFEEARKANEADEKLNELMGKVRLIQMSYQTEEQSENPDAGKLESYNQEFQGIYTEIMTNENMQKYEVARKEVDDMMNYLTGILAMCVNGENPETCDPTPPAHECDGDCCSSCGGGCSH
ncbi:MAG: YlbF family regulator [Oscillospiraceae bacterium]